MSYTEFWKLKRVIVWDVWNFNLEKIDYSFLNSYWWNLWKDKIKEILYKSLYNSDKFSYYKIDNIKIKERNEDLDNLSKILSSLWIIVDRPWKLEKIKTFKTPFFNGVLTPVSNPRDRVIIFWKNIIETPPIIRKRYFENLLLYDLFNKYFEEWYNWIQAPIPKMIDNSMDLWFWEDKRDFNNFDKYKYEIWFDAAQILKIWKDILFNISNYNHEKWAKWLQRILDNLWLWVTIHKIYNIDDNHIDGKISVLKPWVFLINNLWLNYNIIDKLPEKFKSWEIIFTSDEEFSKTIKNDDKEYIKLCSRRGSYTNVLSIDENTVLVLEEAINTIKKLKEKWFNVIPIKLRHCELFGWWLHCATLDIEREDNLINY